MLHKTFQLDSFGLSDIGLVREHNEDVWAAYPEEGLFLLADGMGGHAGGEVASKEAVEHFYTLFKKAHLSDDSSSDAAMLFLEETLAKVNTYIFKKGQEDEVLRGMGTTLCVLFFRAKEAIVAHVGDSRIYRCRKRRLEQLTEDHSLINEMLGLGTMSRHDIETFPYKHILTRAIGTHSRVEPSISSVPVEAGDLFMLCSDGLTNTVSHEQIASLLQSEGALTRKGEALVTLAKQQGGGDNITLILVEAGS